MEYSNGDFFRKYTYRLEAGEIFVSEKSRFGTSLDMKVPVSDLREDKVTAFRQNDKMAGIYGLPGIAIFIATMPFWSELEKIAEWLMWATAGTGILLMLIGFGIAPKKKIYAFKNSTGDIIFAFSNDGGDKRKFEEFAVSIEDEIRRIRTNRVT